MSVTIFKHSRTLTLTVCEEGDDRPLREFKLCVSLGFIPGERESGTSGPPENYDPGSGDEIWVDRITGESVRFQQADPIIGWVDTWLELNRDSLCEECAEFLEAQEMGGEE